MDITLSPMVPIIITGLGGVVGYFKMYQPIGERIAKLETQRTADMEKLNEISDTLKELVNAVNGGFNQVTEISTTLFGRNGENGLRSRIVHLEAEVSVNLIRLTALETMNKR